MDLTSFSGTGFQYIQQQLLRTEAAASESSIVGESDHGNTVKGQADDRGDCLSETAKHLMIHLLKEENIRLSDYPNGILSKSRRRRTESCSMKIIDPTSMLDETILDLAYKNEISLFGSILFILDQYLTNGDPTVTLTNSNISSVPTKYILQKCVYAVPPHQTPGLMSALDMVLMALHFMCQEYSPSTMATRRDVKDKEDASAELRFPLLCATSTRGDLERRSYAKSYDWNIDAILPHVFAVEQAFYNAILDDCIPADAERSDVAPKCYHWLPREKFCPTIPIDDTLRRPLLMHGHNSASTNNSKPKAKATRPVKRKRPLALESVLPTSSDVLKGVDDDSTQSEGEDGAVLACKEYSMEE